MLKWIASVEKNSEHPLAEAVVRKAKEKGVKLEEVEKFDSFSGKGVRAKVREKEVLIGNRILFSERDISIPKEIGKEIERMESQGKTVILFAIAN